MAREVLEFVFWASVAVVVCVYAGYPLALMLLPPRRPHERRRFERLPRVSILIAAHNEEQAIGETIRNKLAVDYPRDLLEIIVVSDASTDGTDHVAGSFGGQGVVLIRQEPRQGKTAALNLARERATGEVIVFSDANSLYEKSALRHLVRAFEDSEVGYATGALLYMNPGEAASAASCGVFMRYENELRRLETRVGSIVGVNGGVDAVRASLYAPMRADQQPDFILPLRVVEQGYRVVFCPEAVSCEEALQAARDEFRMRVRVALRALRSLVEMRRLLSPRHGLFAFQLLVHKVLRYAMFTPLIIAFAANVALGASSGYRALLLAQALFYAAGLLGLVVQGRRGGMILSLPAFFLITNAASAMAFVKLLRGERQVQWEPRKGA